MAGLLILDQIAGALNVLYSPTLPREGTRDYEGETAVVENGDDEDGAKVESEDDVMVDIELEGEREEYTGPPIPVRVDGSDSEQNSCYCSVLGVSIAAIPQYDFSDMIWCRLA